jgi:methyltransferase
VIRTLISLVAILGFMLLEARVSRRNERALRARGAVEPSGDVYRAMQIAYPIALLAPSIEAIVTGPATPRIWIAGVLVFGAAKALKFWAIRSLGPLWSFRVLVMPGAPLVTTGPYRYLRHPNYVAVTGEIAGAATMCAAPVVGAISVLGFGALLRRRIAIEERALVLIAGRSSSSAGSTPLRHQS